MEDKVDGVGKNESAEIEGKQGSLTGAGQPKNEDAPDDEAIANIVQGDVARGVQKLTIDP